MDPEEATIGRSRLLEMRLHCPSERALLTTLENGCSVRCEELLLPPHPSPQPPDSALAEALDKTDEADRNPLGRRFRQGGGRGVEVDA